MVVTMNIYIATVKVFISPNAGTNRLFGIIKLTIVFSDRYERHLTGVLICSPFINKVENFLLYVYSVLFLCKLTVHIYSCYYWIFVAAIIMHCLGPLPPLRCKRMYFLICWEYCQQMKLNNQIFQIASATELPHPRSHPYSD